MKLNKHGMAPCLKCLSVGGPLVTEAYTKEIHEDNNFNPGCQDCGLNGPWFPSLDAAAAWWNERPDPWRLLADGVPLVAGEYLAETTDGQREVLYFEVGPQFWIWPAGVGFVDNVLRWMPIP